MKKIDAEFVKAVEAAHFRTRADTGANHNAMFIWNVVRNHVGLPRITIDELPTYCMTHECFHVIRANYGCVVRKA